MVGGKREVNLTTPETMDIWVCLTNPGSWFAEGLGKAWAHAYYAENGQAYATR